MCNYCSNFIVIQVNKNVPEKSSGWASQILLVRVSMSELMTLPARKVIIEADKAAVRVAVETRYSNALLEGTVNKVKSIKRTMFNRAGIELLRAKII